MPLTFYQQKMSVEKIEHIEQIERFGDCTPSYRKLIQAVSTANRKGNPDDLITQRVIPEGELAMRNNTVVPIQLRHGTDPSVVSKYTPANGSPGLQAEVADELAEITQTYKFCQRITGVLATRARSLKRNESFTEIIGNNLNLEGEDVDEITSIIRGEIKLPGVSIKKMRIAEDQGQQSLVVSFSNS